MNRLPRPMRRRLRREAGIHVVLLLALAKIAQVIIFRELVGFFR